LKINTKQKRERENKRMEEEIKRSVEIQLIVEKLKNLFTEKHHKYDKRLHNEIKESIFRLSFLVEEIKGGY